MKHKLVFLAAKAALYLGLSLTDGGGEEPFRAEAISTCEDYLYVE